MTVSSAPRRRFLPTALAAGALALAALLVSAGPASAHDELVSSDPSADAVLDALPPQITLTYSADVLDAEGATVVEVTDAAGTSLTDGAPVVEGTTVTQALAGTASGTVTVAWRVVSSDGHPIDGTFSFTVPAAPAPTPTASPSPTAIPSTAPSAEPTVTVTATPAPTENTSDASPLPWILLAVALLLVVGALVWLVVARGRNGSPGSGSSGTAGR
ncbi:copper resistance CopC family protein [Microbacterium proteolyticum]|uniref:copper resistance CopC family protein n=1 Tax=Microbacterium proteolyticum TaxID=1572644 RepID=UPI0035C00194